MSELVQFEPRLIVPFELGRRISAENYGSPARGVANNGNVQFVLDEPLWPFLGYQWIGRAFRLYLLDERGNSEEVNAGRVASLTHDTLTAQVATTDASYLLDDALQSNLYGDDALEAIRGQPKPRVWGKVFEVEPVLEDEAALIYRLSDVPLAEVSQVTVGGVAWQEVASAPGPGQWSADLTDGTITLGGVPGGEVRCDAKAVGWETCTAAAVFRDIVGSLDIGVMVNDTVMTQFETDAPHLIGFYAKEAVNRLDVFDALALGTGSWWGLDFDDQVVAGILQAPASDGASADQVTVSALQLSQILSPAWRLRTEYRRNWQPGTQFFDAVPEATQTALSATGIVTTVFEDQTIKDDDPRALDVPTVRLLVNDAADAAEIGARLASLWSVERRLYDVAIEQEEDDLPELYGSASVDYMMVQGDFRVHGLSKAYGGGPHKLTLWG